MGLIGQNVFRVADVEYDLADGVIRLMQPRGCEKSDLAYWAGDKPYLVLSIERPSAESPHTYGEAVVNGVKIRVLFDTGASTSILGVRAAARAGIKTDGPGVRFAGLSSGIGRQMIKNWIAPVASFEINGEKITNTQLRIGEIGSGEDMLLGADFFLSHRVYVANSQRRMYITYNGGPVFNLTRTAQAKAAEPDTTASASAGAPRPSDEDPKDADAFARRGTGFAARREYERAIADYDRAISLAPAEPRYLFERASARIALRRPALAMSDLDSAIRLKPDEPRYRLARASVKLAERDATGAREDLDAAAEHAPKESELRFSLAQAYLGADLFDQAVGQLDLWIGAHRDDNRLPQALGERCFARVLSGRELDLARSDCDRAMRGPVRSTVAMDGRALLELRRGELDRAVADFDLVLKDQPRNAWALYGRGLAKLKNKDKTGGEADLSAAAAVAPRLADRAKAAGLTPSG